MDKRFEMKDFDSIKKIYEECSKAPKGTVTLYNGLWQLETWLREMVYLELRTFEKDWESYLPREKSEYPRSKDKRLTHRKGCGVRLEKLRFAVIHKKVGPVLSAWREKQSV